MHPCRPCAHCAVCRSGRARPFVVAIRISWALAKVMDPVLAGGIGSLDTVSPGSGRPTRHSRVCIVARTRRERDAVSGALAEDDIEWVTLEAGAIDERETEGDTCRHHASRQGPGVRPRDHDRRQRGPGAAPRRPCRAGRRGGGGESAETGERALVYVAATPDEEGAAGVELRMPEAGSCHRHRDIDRIHLEVGYSNRSDNRVRFLGFRNSYLRPTRYTSPSTSIGMRCSNARTKSLYVLRSNLVSNTTCRPSLTVNIEAEPSDRGCFRSSFTICPLICSPREGSCWRNDSAISLSTSAECSLKYSRMFSVPAGRLGAQDKENLHTSTDFGQVGNGIAEVRAESGTDRRTEDLRCIVRNCPGYDGGRRLQCTGKLRRDPPREWLYLIKPSPRINSGSDGRVQRQHTIFRRMSDRGLRGRDILGFLRSICLDTWPEVARRRGQQMQAGCMHCQRVRRSCEGTRESRANPFMDRIAITSALLADRSLKTAS